MKAINLEEEFKFEEAIACYKELISQGNCEITVLNNLQKLLIDFGELNEAAEIAIKKIESYPETLEYKRELEQIAEKIENYKIKAKLFEAAGEKEKSEVIKAKDIFNYPDNNLIKRVMELFSGREDVFAVQWSYDGKNGYSPQRRKMTEKDTLLHILGRKTIGVYQLKNDNSIKFAAFDLDIKKGIKIESQSEVMEILKSSVQNIYTRLREIGFKPYIEFSGNKGYHIWVFFDRSVQSYKVKKIFENIKNELEENEKIGIEIFPKQIKTEKDRFGNLIKIPLGIHKKTGKRCLFADETLNIAENQREFIITIEESSSEILDKIYREDDTVNVEFYEKPERTAVHEKNIKNSIRKEIPEKPIFMQELNILKRNCIVLNYIIEKSEKTGFLSEEDEKIAAEVVKNCKNGEIILKEIMMKCINYNENRFKILIKKMSKYPVSCENIRRKILENGMKIELENCSCRFNERFNTPVNHLYSLDQYLIENLEIEEMIKKILEKQKEKSEIDKEIESLKKIVNLKMECESEECYAGTIRKKGDSVEITI